MRAHIRTAVVLVVAAGLVVLFLRNVDLWHVGSEIAHAHPGWLALSLVTMFVNLTIRSLRWQYLLEPLGHASFANSFRATAVGFAASSILPARAGEFIRPYFLARHENMTATGAFATIVLERVLDVLTVLTLLALFIFIFDPGVGRASPTAWAAVKWAGLTAGGGALAALVVMFVLAGDPERLGRTMSRLEQVLPSTLAGLIARVAEKFARGLGAVRKPGRLIVALLWSFPLWLSIAVGMWSVAVAFHLAVPFTGSFLLVALLVIGVAVPTPGAIGGFHEAFRLGTTLFFGAREDAAVGAAIVAHVFSIGPALLLGLFFAAQAGLNMSGMQRLASEAKSGRRHDAQEA
jgi:glycosyltransferase 2 family protein